MKDRRCVLVVERPADLSGRWATNTLRPLSPMPPLGVLWLAAALERAGWSVAVLDNSVEGLSEDALAGRVLGLSPGVAGLSLTTLNAPASLRLAARLSASGVPVLAGGPHASALPVEVSAAPGISASVCGEADEIVVPLAEALLAGKIPESAPGVYVGGRGAGAAAPPEDLDALGLPARHLVDLSRYNRRWLDVSSGPVDSLATSRGCPFRCAFCGNAGVWGGAYRRQRTRSAPRVADEMESLAARYGSQGFFFREDNLTARRTHIEALCAEFERRGFRFPWKCEAHVATVDAELLEKMARAGLRSIWFGIESGSDAVLRRLNKGFTAARAREVIAAAAGLGLHTAGTFLLGVPGETPEDVEESLRLVEEGGLDEAWFQVFLGFPGTPLSGELRERSLVEEEWSGLLIPRTEAMSFAELSAREREIRERLGRHFRARAARGGG